MNKQTKNVISREWVERELRFYNTADIRYTLVLSIAFTPFFVLFAVLSAYSVCSSIENILLKIVLSIIACGITSSPIWFILFVLRNAFAERKMLQRGEFDIVTREVLYKSEKAVNRHIVELLHFQDFKEISVSHTIFQLSSVGDTFYIIHYKTKNVIKLLYSAKMYEYK